MIEYKKNGTLISQRKFVSELEMEILTDDGVGQVKNLGIVPIVVSLPAKGYYKDYETELIVSLIDEEGNKIKELFRRHVYQWQD